MIEGQDYERVSVAQSSDLVSKITFKIKDSSAGDYKCQAEYYDDFCTSPQTFDSEVVSLTIISATPITNPASATVNSGTSHVFDCVFPNPFGNDFHEITWSFKGPTDSAAKVNHH